MRTWKQFRFKTVAKERFLPLLEAVTPELKARVVKEIDAVDDDAVLNNVLVAISANVMETLLKQKADDATITMNQDAFVDELMGYIRRTGESVDNQVSFVRELVTGKVFDAKGLVKSSLKGIANLHDYVKTKNPVWSKVRDDMLAMQPKIDLQNIGSGEVVYIMSTVGGAKGMDGRGDAYLGSGLNVELKQDGGTLSKPTTFADGKLEFINAFDELGVKITAKEADAMGLGSSDIYGESNSKGGIAKALSLGSKKYTSLYMDVKGATQRQADKAMEDLYKRVCQKCMPNNGPIPYTFKKTVSNGLTDPNEFVKQWDSNAFHDYMHHGFDVVTLFNGPTKSNKKYTGDTISFKSAQDFYKSKNWNVGTEWMLRWSGGGGFSGTGSSTRIYIGAWKNVAIYDPGDTKFEEKISQKNEIRKSLKHALGQLAQKKNSAKIKAAFSKANDLKGPMNDVTRDNELKDLQPLFKQIGKKINDYFKLKKELRFGFDKADRDLTTGFKNMKSKFK